MQIQLTALVELEQVRPLFPVLMQEFGPDAIRAVKRYVDPKRVNDGTFWQIWIIEEIGSDEPLGIIGLYDLDGKLEHFWLGWFALRAVHRGAGIGTQALLRVQMTAVRLGGRKLSTYIDSSRKPLKFYLRNGFVELGTVEQYLKWYPELDSDEFGEPSDFVLAKSLLN